jgi:hypothetical protein
MLKKMLVDLMYLALWVFASLGLFGLALVAIPQKSNAAQKTAQNAPRIATVTKKTNTPRIADIIVIHSIGGKN